MHHTRKIFPFLLALFLLTGCSGTAAAPDSRQSPEQPPAAADNTEAAYPCYEYEGFGIAIL